MYSHYLNHCYKHNHIFALLSLYLMLKIFWAEPHHQGEKRETKVTQFGADVQYDSRRSNWWVTVVHSSLALCAHHREAIGIDWCSGQHFWEARWRNSSSQAPSFYTTYDHAAHCFSLRGNQYLSRAVAYLGDMFIKGANGFSLLLTLCRSY